MLNAAKEPTSTENITADTLPDPSSLLTNVVSFPPLSISTSSLLYPVIERNRNYPHGQYKVSLYAGYHIKTTTTFNDNSQPLKYILQHKYSHLCTVIYDTIPITQSCIHKDTTLHLLIESIVFILLNNLSMSFLIGSFPNVPFYTADLSPTSM